MDLIVDALALNINFTLYIFSISSLAKMSTPTKEEYCILKAKVFLGIPLCVIELRQSDYYTTLITTLLLQASILKFG